MKLAALVPGLALAGCGGSKTLLSPKDPTMLSIWHVYGEQADSPMNRLLTEFNDTVGREKGILLNVTNMTNSAAIGGQLQDAKAVLDGRPSYCINIVRDISPNCDCHPENDVPIVPDVGMFASADPVALDLACAEAINRQPVLPNSAITDLKHEHDCDRFHAAHDNTHWQDLIEHGKKLGIGQDTYELVTIR